MPAQVIDLFCGVGGLTRGLLDAGLDVIAGFDIDPTCQFTYEQNNHVDYNVRNIREVTSDEIQALYDHDATTILVGCAPCQPFSQMRFKLRDANIQDDTSNDYFYGKCAANSRNQYICAVFRYFTTKWISH